VIGGGGYCYAVLKSHVAAGDCWDAIAWDYDADQIEWVGG
jgi:hypothetical protein